MVGLEVYSKKHSFLPAAKRHGHKEGGIVGVGVVGTFRSCSLFLHGKPQDLEKLHDF